MSVIMKRSIRSVHPHLTDILPLIVKGAVILILSASDYLPTALSEQSWDRETVQLIANARPAVVNIEAKSPMSSRMGPLGDVIASQMQNEDGQVHWYTTVGSGVIWDIQGHVVTTASVVKDAVKFVVKTVGNQSFDAELIAKDEETNLAILRFQSNESEYKTIHYRMDKLPEGSWLALLGYGFGGVPTISTGIAGMPPEDYDPSRNWFQFTAPLRAGNSGGALIDSNGQLAGIVLGREEDIGVNAVLRLLTQQAQPSNSDGQTAAYFSSFGVAIPAPKVAHIIQNLLNHGKVIRGWIGVGVTQTPLGSDKNKYCLLVTRILPESPAEQSGLKQGDLLLKIDDTSLQLPSELGRIINAKEPGTIVTLTYMRNDAVHTTDVTVQLRPPMQKRLQSPLHSEIPAKMFPEEFGIELQELKILESATGISTPTLQIKQVTPGSPAEAQGLQTHDIIRSINGIPVSDINTLMIHWAVLNPGDSVDLAIQRNNQSIMIHFVIPSTAGKQSMGADPDTLKILDHTADGNASS